MVKKYMYAKSLTSGDKKQEWRFEVENQIKKNV